MTSLAIVIRAAVVALSLTLLACAPLSGSRQPDAQPYAAYVVLGENGSPIARVLTPAAQCPVIRLDGKGTPMQLRARTQALPQRPTRSAPADSRPSDFPLLTCELAIPAHTTTAQVQGRHLPLPRAEIKRIVVIGDTGCRLKKSEHAFQACNDPAQYPFARVAARAAAWQPDLVIHVGDYLYRENACPSDQPGCAGSSWGYGWDAWRDDFFKPAAPLLQAAPWIVVRGNHESCARAGQGWWRMFDPRPLLPGRDCNDAANDDNGDFSDPYAVPLGGHAQVIVLDSSDTAAKPMPAGDVRAARYRDMYHKAEDLSRQAAYNIGVDHHPILGFETAWGEAGKVKVLTGNKGLQSVLGSLGPLMLPPRIDVMLSGHVHAWQEVSYSTEHATQFVAGFSGTQEDVVPLPEVLPAGATPVAGGVVEHHSSWVGGFGFMTMERSGADRWIVHVWDADGRPVNHCRIEGRKSQCDLALAK